MGDLVDHGLARDQRDTEIKPQQIAHPLHEGREPWPAKAKLGAHRIGRRRVDIVIAVAPGGNAPGRIAGQAAHHREGGDPDKNRHRHRLHKAGYQAGHSLNRSPSRPKLRSHGSITAPSTPARTASVC